MVSAAITGRRGRGIELDPKYCDVILGRLATETGFEPRLADGTLFAQVAATRALETGEIL